jgi:hypothetical protein
VTSD